MSHAAVFMACQIPDRSGLPSRVRGIAVAAGAWATPPELTSEAGPADTSPSDNSGARKAEPMSRNLMNFLSKALLDRLNRVIERKATECWRRNATAEDGG